jgi:glycosyltransferase involved in cell wall biosynthesis
LTALVERPDHVCCRYRLAAFRPFLEQAGHTLAFRQLPRDWLSWFRLPHELRGTDAVILQRRLLQRWQLFLLRRAAKTLLYDFDDAVFLRDSYASQGLHSAGRLRRFRALMNASDAVIPGNAFLQEWAGRYLDTQRTQVVPTCLDPGSYPLADHTRIGAGVQLVWIGSSSTLQGLEAIRPLLEEVGRRSPGLRLKLICDRFLHLLHLPILVCPWSEATEAAELAAADIGVSWLPDDLWSRGKCGLKVLQYMAAGLPVVANPVGVQRELVRHGETGYLVQTPADWTAAIGRLAHDPAHRRQMGQAGRRLVEAKFSIPVGAAGWLSLLEKLRQGREAA